MAYIEPENKLAGQFVHEDDFNLLVTNIIDHNSRISALQSPGSADLAIGSVILYFGLLSNLPTGWAVCDGLNGTPDLRNRFVLGSGDLYPQGGTGGASSHSHTNPSTNAGGGHDHSFGGDSATSFGLSSVTSTSGDIVNNPHYHTWSVSPSIGHHTHTKPSTGSSGGQPPLMALYYIMRIA